MRLLLSMQAVMVIVPTWAAAQTVQPVAVVAEWPVAAGARVRVLSPVLGDRKQTATVISATSDTLFFRAEATDRSIATSQITKLEVSQGTRTRVRRGAFMGFLIGGLSGAALGAATYQPCDACFTDFERGGTAVATGAIGAAVGTIVGALVGMRRVDSWVPVRIR